MGHGQFFDATPAYGRDYKNQKDVLRDWHSDKDFMIHSGLQSTYTNKADMAGQGHRLILRYANGMKTMMLHGDMKEPAWLGKERSGQVGTPPVKRSHRAARSPQAEAEDALGLQPGEGAW